MAERDSTADAPLANSLRDDWAAEALWLAGPDGGPLSDRLDLLDRHDPRTVQARAPLPGFAPLLTWMARWLRIPTRTGLEAQTGQAPAPNPADRRLLA